MESNGLPGRMFSGIGSGMLGLEMPLHQHPNPHHQQPKTPHHIHHLHMVANYGHQEPDQHHHHHQNPQPQQSAKQLYPYGSKAAQQVAVSDEDEPGSAADDGAAEGKRKMSPWQRMKWTDNMVRLLVMAVYYIGDEAGPEAGDGKKKGCGGGAGLLQKKGKWKSVSQAMMEKGFYVSPQQCEDKFNDLNKRYKRVNDILGKGTACKVVENQSLLETMDLSPKMKEEVRKLLNSKHLFFREMCAYHNSCGHGGGAGGGAQQSPENGGAAEPSSHGLHLHSPENALTGKVETKMAGGGSSEEDEEEDEDDDDSENEYDEDDENNERHSRKRPRRNGSSPSLQQLGCEMSSMLQDGAKSPSEKRHWIKTRLVELEEQQLQYRCQALELEKQRLKWIKFSSKKEREMERAKLENERKRLENERMVLVVKQKELELVHLRHHPQLNSNRKPDPSSNSITG